jgi:hypothetical protein
MCNRVLLIVESFECVVQVHTANGLATIRIPGTTNAAQLGDEIRGYVDTEQHECAVRLWGDDSYTRNFGYLPQGITITCAPSS